MVEQPNAVQPVMGEQAELRTTPWAICALVLGVLGLCCFPVGLVGAALGVVALTKIEKDRALGGKALAIVGLSIGAASVVLNGIFAALAVPAFVGYVRRSKTVEVTTNLNAIYAAVEERYHQDGKIDPVALTPSEVPCAEAHVWTAAELARFAGIGFAPAAATNYSYEVVTTPADVHDSVAIIRARGDLDCDGNTSLFELAIGKDGSGGLSRTPGFEIQNEIE